MSLRHPLTIAAAAAALFAAAFVGAPLAAMFLDTVRGAAGFSLAPWREILADPVDRVQLAHSLQLGLLATAVAVLFGGAHAWLTCATDLPGRAIIGPLGVLPLAIPPVVLAMSYADFTDSRGVLACALLLGLANAPFVAVLTARGLRSIDGRAYEAAELAAGRGRADGMLLRAILPELAAGALFAFIFVVSEHGVPEFLTVKGKEWHTYAEGVFSRWSRRVAGADAAALGSPAVAAIPLVLLIAASLALALKLRGSATVEGDFAPLPARPLGRLRYAALLVPAVYLGATVGVPLYVMGAWSAGSTRADGGLSAARSLESFRLAVREAGGDLSYTLLLGAGAAAITLAVALPVAWLAARRRGWIDHLAVLPLAVPAILLGIGLVKAFNRAEFGDFYDGPVLLACAYAARFLPLAVLALSAQARRIPREVDDAARLAEGSALRRGLRIQGPLLAPAAWSAACALFLLCLRELDLAVVLPAGNGTIVRRLSNIVHFGGEELGGALALLLLLLALLAPLFTVLLTGRRLRSLS